MREKNNIHPLFFFLFFFFWRACVQLEGDQPRAGSALERELRQMQQRKVKETLLTAVSGDAELAMQCAMSLLETLTPTQRAMLGEHLATHNK